MSLYINTLNMFVLLYNFPFMCMYFYSIWSSKIFLEKVVLFLILYLLFILMFIYM